MSKILYGLDPQEYEHPLDREALNALQKISGIQAIFQKFEGSTLEKALILQHKGEKLKVNEKNFKKLYQLFLKGCEILDFDEPPDLYTSWEYQLNACAFGVEKPSIFISSGCIDILDDSALSFIIGHELAHIKSGHMFYYMLAQRFLPFILANIPIPNIPILGGVLVETIKYPLYNWKRMTELTCDRGGLLCCQNNESAFKALIALAGVPLKYQDEDFVNSFIEQSRIFIEDDFEPTDKIIKKLSQTYSFDHFFKYGQTVPRSHPLPMLRIGKLNEWIESGKYDEVKNREREKVTIIYCSKCNEIIDNGDKICGFCGAKNISAD